MKKVSFESFLWFDCSSWNTFVRNEQKFLVRMINVYNQTELVSRQTALTFLSRSQSTISRFPDCPSLEMSKKSTLPWQTVWMDLANYRTFFLGNCKHNFSHIPGDISSIRVSLDVLITSAMPFACLFLGLFGLTGDVIRRNCSGFKFCSNSPD